MIRTTPSAAYVETLVAQGVTHVFGIVGSACMHALDLVPAAGIRHVPPVREQGAGHIAEGDARASGRHGVSTAQNGPCVTQFAIAIAAARWAHTLEVMVAPESGPAAMDLAGFRATERLPIASKITKCQGHVNDPIRIAGIAARCFERALLRMGLTEPNIPRDRVSGGHDYTVPSQIRIARGPGDARAAAEATMERPRNRDTAPARTRQSRAAEIAAVRAEWQAELDAWSLEQIAADPDLLHPRREHRALERAMPTRAMVSTASATSARSRPSVCVSKRRARCWRRSGSASAAAHPDRDRGQGRGAGSPRHRLCRRGRLGHEPRRAPDLRAQKVPVTAVVINTRP